MEEKEAYAEGFKDAVVLLMQNTDKIMGKFDESVKEVLESKSDFAVSGDYFEKIFYGKIEDIISANALQEKMKNEIRHLAGIARFAFIKGGGVMLDKIMTQLDENIAGSLKKILGEKDYPGRRWDISNFGDN